MGVAWAYKYRFPRFSELLFSSTVGFDLLKYIKTNDKGCVAHLLGSPGAGKSALIQAISRLLKYNLVVLGEDELADIKKYNTAAKTLNNKRTLLVIEEPPSTSIYQIMSALKTPLVPVIIVSCDLVLKNVQTFKMERQSLDNIIKVLERIAKAEQNAFESRLLSQLASSCNYDMRALINYMQLFSNTKLQMKHLKIIDRSVSASTYGMCNKICENKPRPVDIAEDYSPKIGRLCLNAFIHFCKNEELLLKTLDSFSEADALPEQYHFTAIDKICQATMSYSYCPDATSSSKAEYDENMEFSKMLKQSIKNMAQVRRFQELSSTHKMPEFDEQEKALLNRIEVTAKETKRFKYSYNHGTSNAVRRDITLGELLN
ncbi:hypothetical protein ENBRE01_0136 [Enteropsectra breve]|nr:hypothetical protein ENBRE01_0136 [Enteropsectra breve]